MLVGVGDVPPLVKADRLGGDVLTDSLGVGEDLYFRAVSFDLKHTRKTQKGSISQKTHGNCRYKKLMNTSPPWQR